jgi:putative transposase
MSYSTGSHTVFYHRYHIVWITKYRYKVLQGKLRERVRDIIRQVCREMGVQIIEGVLSSDHIHMFVSVPPHVAISDLMQRAKGRSSYKIQMEFPEIRKRYWGRRFWARGYFCTTSGNVTDDIILFSIFRTTLINLPTPVGSCLVVRIAARNRRWP